MFCPKCGLQNADNAKFCRSCGANLSNVLAVVEGKLPDRLAEPENHNDLYSLGIKNLLLGISFIIISILLYNIPGDTFFWLLMLFPAFSLIASGISRIVKANGIKSNKNADFNQVNSFPVAQANQSLPPLQTEYIKPLKSVYETDDLAGQPLSVTEPTTRHLQMDSEGKTVTMPKK